MYSIVEPVLEQEQQEQQQEDQQEEMRDQNQDWTFVLSAGAPIVDLVLASSEHTSPLWSTVYTDN